MKIAVLEDRKGFTMSMQVPYFPPYYKITDVPPVSVFDSMPEEDKVKITAYATLCKEITFYPTGVYKDINGIEIQKYVMK